MKLTARYPTVEHRRGAEAIVSFFSMRPGVEAVILYGSCARGKATHDSCLDVWVLVPPELLSAEKAGLEQEWSSLYRREDAFEELRKVGRYSHVDLNFIDGHFEPRPRDWTSGPDEFELEIGNTLVYVVTLWERGDYPGRLKAQWLPYYEEELRRERLATVRRYFVNNLDHVPLFVDRRLYFQAFKRLYDAFREFLQALFISRRTYPIAYDKWIQEQIEEILEMPELYEQLRGILEVRRFESAEIGCKAEKLAHLFEEYVRE